MITVRFWESAAYQKLSEFYQKMGGKREAQIPLSLGIFSSTAFLISFFLYSDLAGAVHAESLGFRVIRICPGWTTAKRMLEYVLNKDRAGHMEW